MRKWLRIIWPPIFATLVVCATVWATGSLTTPNVIFTQPNPVPTSKLDQNWTAHATYINAREITFGLVSARPTAGVAGRYYFGTDTQILYADTGTAWTQLAPAANSPAANVRASLTLANSTGSTQFFSVFPGAASSDDTTIADRILMTLPSTYTKKLTSWAVGTGLGCLDTGSVAAFTFYHVYLIERVDTGVVDVLCSVSGPNSTTSPTMPSNYTKKQRLGAIRTTWFGTPGNEIYFFTQTKNRFLWATNFTTNLNVDNATPGTNANIATVSVPNGVIVKALLNGGANSQLLLVSPLTISDESATGIPPGGSCGPGATVTWCQMTVLTDTAQRIRYRVAGNVQTYIVGYGWEEMWD